MATFKEMQDTVGREMRLDLDSPYSNALTDREMIKGYLNAAQRILAREIVKFKEDYFLTYVDIPAAPGVNEYPLPADILINKVRRVTYKYSGEYYGLKALTLDEFYRWRGDNEGRGPTPLGYFLVEAPGQAVTISLAPLQALESVSLLRIFYLRKVAEMTADDDIPEMDDSEDFLVAHAKWKASINDPTREEEAYESDRDKELKNLIETFVDRAPRDGGDELEIPCEEYDMSVNPSEAL